MASRACMELRQAPELQAVQLARRSELKHVAGMSTVARFRDAVEDGRRVLHFEGDLTLARLGALPARLDRLKGRGFLLDLGRVERVDTIGGRLGHRTARPPAGESVGARE